MGQLGFSGVYSTELFGSFAAQTILEHAAGSDGGGANAPPLFLYVAFEAVHGASSCYVHEGAPNCERPDDDELQVPEQPPGPRPYTPPAPPPSTSPLPSP